MAFGDPKLHEPFEKVGWTVFDYRGKSFEHEQLGAWRRQCSEGVLTGDETTATELLLDAFVTQVHEEETKELARIRKKVKAHPAAGRKSYRGRA